MPMEPHHTISRSIIMPPLLLLLLLLLVRFFLFPSPMRAECFGI